MENNQKSYDSEIVQFEEIFLPISKAITSFSEEYGMFLEKYYQRQPIWTLFFIRKVGGIAQIAIQLNKFDNFFYISILWSIDVYEERTRYTKDWDKFESYWKLEHKDPKLVNEILVKALNILKTLKRDDLNVPYRIGKLWEQRWHTKEEFEKQYTDRYPVLDI